jgi:CubicO group peptidase (beta-lactamase class C family)
MKRSRSQVWITALVAAVGLASLAPAAQAHAPAALAGPSPLAAQVEQQEGEPVGEVTRAKVEAAIDSLKQLAEEAVTSGDVPGLAIAVVYGDEVLYLGGFGVRDTGSGEPVDENTVFQLASMSKPLAATVVSALVSDGVVSWDDRVIDHNPGFQMYDPWVTREVTIRDFFSHRSGLPGSAGDDIEEIGYDRDDIQFRLRFLPPASSFRSRYAYSNAGITAGGVAAALAAGLEWEEVSEVKLYEPLGMTATSSRYADYAAADNRALLHTRLDGGWAAQFTRQPDAESPAGGASSTAHDMAQWMRLLLNEGMFEGEQVIAADALAQMYVPQIVRGRSLINGAPDYYGLGWNVTYDEDGRVYAGHAGAFSNGARTLINLLPEEKLGIVVLTNAFPTGVPEGLSASFYDFVLRGESSRDWVGFWNDAFQQLAASFSADSAQYATPPAEPAPALPLGAYTGTYTNDYVGDVEIVERDGGLVLLVGPDQVASPLEHWNRDTFLYVPDPSAPDARSSVRFTIGADGTADGAAISTYAANGQAAFGRVP